MSYPLSTQPALVIPPGEIEIPFRRNIYTDVAGYKTIVAFYRYVARLRNQIVRLTWQSKTHFDANLSALLLALIQEVSRKNNVRFLLDGQSISGTHDIFARNGLERAIHGTPFVLDKRQSTIPVRCFTVDQPDAFSDYVRNDMFRHHRLSSLPEIVKQRIGSYFAELFCNVEIHAETNEVFVCGQFFPAKRELRFTMVDLGCGFLQKIAACTQGTAKINSAPDAIKWAISGNTTKTQAAGGSGLRNILKHCIDTGNSVHIVTDGCYWQYDPAVNRGVVHQSLDAHVDGTTIHMIFRGL